MDKWNLVSEKGLPEDGEWCFLVWQDEAGEFEWCLGGYSENEKQFYVNFGMGGLVLGAEHVVAWAKKLNNRSFGHFL